MSTTVTKEDYLEVDPPIPGQNFVCMSFVSPEEMIRKREIYQGQKFIQWLLEQTHHPEHPISLEKAAEMCTMSGYLDYAINHEEENNTKFNELNDFRTSTRGVKIRGVYESLKEAQKRAKVLQTRDPTFHVYVGQVGYWLPWDPNPDNIENQEYADGQLNELVRKYKENKSAKDQIWHEETQRRIQMAREEGARNKEIESTASDFKSETTGNATLFEGEDVFLSRKREQGSTDAAVEKVTEAVKEL
jgi:hypothetical protein